ncbi:MAG TPA: hypothetical protein VFJ94_07945 [Intrasporangium sp.]|uniref:hypothetical protein n=1 Tax=Intrasporangium sp. TaxID=1925024 RepID=UPI002D796935|nr:hypothetical protein [Intrasporangium sp.]HET7398440.1 hypothetical protein [Intrasporangium sp.]
MTLRISRANLGAWVIKANPAARDPQRFAAEHASVADRCVAANYRSALIQAGDPVVLWVSGPERDPLQPGVWGVGRVVAPVARARASGSDGPASGTPKVTLDVPLLEAPVPRALLRATAALAGCEVLRQPQMGNPGWLDGAEWAALQELLASR